MKIAAVQHDVVWEDAAATQRHVTGLVERAAAEGARLVLLTEMYATGFSMDAARVAEPFDGPSAAFIARLARAHGIWLGGSVAERERGAPPESLPGNVLVLAGPDGQVHRYSKIHPFSFAGEHERYRAGKDYVTVEVEGVMVSLFVCYDLRFADDFWALANETDLYVVVANWPESRRDHWRVLLRARAIENQAYVAGVNRVGTGGDQQYVGDSLIVSPWGETLADGDGMGEAVLIADVDPDVVRSTRERYPFLVDRR